MASVITPLQRFISKAEEKHGKIYDYSKTLYVNRTEKITIICQIHGEFTQNAGSHLSGCGCRKCGIEQTMKKRTLSVDDFIEKAKEIHNNKYSYDKTNYSKRNDHIIIICPIHGEFTQLPKCHLKGYGCRKCANELISKNKRKSHDTFIQESIKQHGEIYDYSKTLYIDCYTPVIIICKKHGEFQQSPSDHLSGRGCVNCGIERRIEIRKKSVDEFMEKAIEQHGIRYDYSKINYIDLKTKILIICKKHGEFEQTPSKHILGQGCKKCGDETTSNKLCSTTDKFIEKANIKHNCKYDYSKTQYIRSNDKVIIICPMHGPYLQTPSDHLCGYGCNKCSYRISTPSKEWLSMIRCTFPNIQTGDHTNGEYRIPNTRYHADGYCPDTNTIFEFHGDYWHGNPSRYESSVYNKTTGCTMGELYEKTIQKRIACEKQGYHYIEIWESQWNTLKRVILNKQRQFKYSSH